MKKLLFIFLLMLWLSVPAFAASVNTNLNVTASVVAACENLSTTPVNFGTFAGGSNTTASGSVTVTCTNGVPYNIALDKGVNGDAFGRSIKQTGGTFLEGYNLFQDSGQSQPWGDQGFGNTFNAPPRSANGTGSAQTHTVFGQVQGSTSTPVGDYTDTVVVTIHF